MKCWKPTVGIVSDLRFGLQHIAEAKFTGQDRCQMATIDPSTEERLRQGFKRYLNPFMLTMWRLGMGKWFKVWPEISGKLWCSFRLDAKLA